ncbi:TetR family transcriptional regulator OS=Ureibacillus acetophenoni OX=614649 GN=SAMN05877842_104204 PE=4 SV=1 [Ureibacillus acetophenoni]
MLIKQHGVENDDALKVTALMLSWGLYGASVEWRRSSQYVTPEVYIKKVIPFITNGINK